MGYRCASLGPADEALLSDCRGLLNIDEINSEHPDIDWKTIRFILDNAYIENDRIVVPALWDEKFIKFLPKNYKLALKVLNSNYKKYSKDKAKLKEYDRLLKDSFVRGAGGS